MSAKLECNDSIAMCAFRYVLGRRTYQVPFVVEWLIESQSKLNSDTRAQIVKEIDVADERGEIGMDMDRAEWMKCRTALAG